MGIFEGIDDEVVEQLVLENETCLKEVAALRQKVSQLQAGLDTLTQLQLSPPAEAVATPGGAVDRGSKQDDERACAAAAHCRSASIEELREMASAALTDNASLLRGRLPALTSLCLAKVQSINQHSASVASHAPSPSAPWATWGKDVDGLVQCIECLAQMVALVGAPMGGGAGGGMQRSLSTSHPSSAATAASAGVQPPPMLSAPRLSGSDGDASGSRGPSEAPAIQRVDSSTPRVALSAVHRTSITSTAQAPSVPLSRRRERSHSMGWEEQQPMPSTSGINPTTTQRRPVDDHILDLPLPPALPPQSSSSSMGSRKLSTLAHEMLPDRQSAQPTPSQSRTGSVRRGPMPHRVTPSPQPQYLIDDDEDMGDAQVPSPARMVSRNAAANRSHSARTAAATTSRTAAATTSRTAQHLHRSAEHAHVAAQDATVVSTRPRTDGSSSGVLSPLGSANVVNTPPLKKRRSDCYNYGQDTERSLLDSPSELVAF